MSFCTNCGQAVTEGAKFCANCGTQLISDSQNYENERKFVYEGEIHKCPNCGEVLKSFEAYCSSCGFELRGVEGSSAVKELVKKIEELDAQKANEGFIDGIKRKFNGSKLSASEEQKIALINNFPIPNTKEDILEFMILSSTNASKETPYGANSNHDTMLHTELKKVWKTKFNQAYEKSKICIKNESDRVEIEEYYHKIVVEPRLRAKKIAQKSTITSLSFILAVAILITFGTLKNKGALNFKTDTAAVGVSIEEIKGLPYSEVVETFNEKGFYNIEILDGGWRLGYDSNEVCNVKIEGRDNFFPITRIHKDTKITITYASEPIEIEILREYEDFIGENYEDVKIYFESIGFSVIECREDGWSLFHKSGTTKSILINGKEGFSYSDKIYENAKIVINYYK